MMTDFPEVAQPRPCPMVDIEELAALLNVPPAAAYRRMIEEFRSPAVSYRGKPLWYASDAQDMVAA